MMKKEEFLKYESAKIHELIAERYSGDIEVRQAAVVKMNDQKLNGLSVFLDGNNVCPTIYLDDAFEAYVNGTDPDRIAEDIPIQAFDAGRMAPSADTLEQLPDLSGKRLALRLLEASRNREFLKDTPYMEVGNGLVLVCDVRIQENSDGCFSTVVNNNLLKVMGREKADVFRQALKEAWVQTGPFSAAWKQSCLAEMKQIFWIVLSLQPPECISSPTQAVFTEQRHFSILMCSRESLRCLGKIIMRSLLQQRSSLSCLRAWAWDQKSLLLWSAMPTDLSWSRVRFSVTAF